MQNFEAFVKELHASEDCQRCLYYVHDVLHHSPPRLTPTEVAARSAGAPSPSWRSAFLSAVLALALPEQVQPWALGPEQQFSSCHAPSVSRRVPARPRQRRTLSRMSGSVAA